MPCWRVRGIYGSARQCKTRAHERLPGRIPAEAYSSNPITPARIRVGFSETADRGYAIIIVGFPGRKDQDLSDGLDMKCQICGCAPVPGAKLCLDCRAARKRAFDATVTQPLLAAAGARRRSYASPRLLKPGRSLPDASRRAAKQAQAANGTSPPDAVSTGRWPFAGAGLAILLVAGTYVTQRFDATEVSTQSTPEQSAREALISTQVQSSARLNPTATPTVAQTSSSGAPMATGNPSFQAAPSMSPAGTEAPRRHSLRARPAPAVALAAAPEPPPVVQPTAEPAALPVAREAPRPDPWQQMDDALARCTRDDMSGRLMCEQRVRLQHCDGRWGQVPQCASIPYIEHGG